MCKLVILGFCPNHIKEKAKDIARCKDGFRRRRKLRTLGQYYTIKLSKGYRLLLSQEGKSYVCNHDSYVRRINRLR
jgi:hypothetical protein